MDPAAPRDQNAVVPSGLGGGTGPLTTGGSDTLSPQDELAFVTAIYEAMIGQGSIMGVGMINDGSASLPMLDPARRIQELRKQEEKRTKEEERRREERKQRERA